MAKHSITRRIAKSGSGHQWLVWFSKTGEAEYIERIFYKEFNARKYLKERDNVNTTNDILKDN